MALHPTIRQIFIQVPEDLYQKMLKNATEGNHPSVESYLMSLGEPLPPAKVQGSEVIFSRPEPKKADEKEKSKGK